MNLLEKESRKDLTELLRKDNTVDLAARSTRIAAHREHTSGWIKSHTTPTQKTVSS